MCPLSHAWIDFLEFSFFLQLLSGFSKISSVKIISSLISYISWYLLKNTTIAKYYFLIFYTIRIITLSRLLLLLVIMEQFVCGYCLCPSITQWEFSGTQYVQFCLFKVHFKQEVTSSKKTHFGMNCGSLLTEPTLILKIFATFLSVCSGIMVKYGLQMSIVKIL